MGGMENYRAQEAMYAANKASSIQAYQDVIEAMNLDHIASQEQATQDRMQVAAEGLATIGCRSTHLRVDVETR